MSVLPEQYRILPEIIDFELTGFPDRGGRSLALRQRACDEWFEEFAARLVQAVGSARFLPVCRLSDGEFIFALGEQPESSRLPRHERIRRSARRRALRALRGGGFGASTRPGVSSGAYTRDEWLRARRDYPAMVREIAEKGILALHLTFGPVPFQEQYFPALQRWMDANGIVLTERNYFPFYFVYALLSGPWNRRLIAGRRVLLVNAASSDKRRRIAHALMSIGAADVQWLEISPDRSLFDRIDTSSVVGEVDLAFVGAGVGKPNVLLQLEPLQVPVIDAGYMMEVWSDASLAARRPFCRYNGAGVSGRGA